MTTISLIFLICRCAAPLFVGELFEQRLQGHVQNVTGKAGTSLPSWLTFEGGMLRGIPNENETGNYELEVSRLRNTSPMNITVERENASICYHRNTFWLQAVFQEEATMKNMVKRMHQVLELGINTGTVRAYMASYEYIDSLEYHVRRQTKDNDSFVISTIVACHKNHEETWESVNRFRSSSLTDIDVVEGKFLEPYNHSPRQKFISPMYNCVRCRLCTIVINTDHFYDPEDDDLTYEITTSWLIRKNATTFIGVTTSKEVVQTIMLKVTDTKGKAIHVPLQVRVISRQKDDHSIGIQFSSPSTEVLQKKMATVISLFRELSNYLELPLGSLSLRSIGGDDSKLGTVRISLEGLTCNSWEAARVRRDVLEMKNLDGGFLIAKTRFDTTCTPAFLTAEIKWNIQVAGGILLIAMMTIVFYRKSWRAGLNRNGKNEDEYLPEHIEVQDFPIDGTNNEAFTLDEPEEINSFCNEVCVNSEEDVAFFRGDYDCQEDE